MSSYVHVKTSIQIHMNCNTGKLGLVVKAERFNTLGLDNKDDPMAWGQCECISGQLMAGQKLNMAPTLN